MVVTVTTCAAKYIHSTKRKTDKFCIHPGKQGVILVTQVTVANMGTFVKVKARGTNVVIKLNLRVLRPLYEIFIICVLFVANITVSTSNSKKKLCPFSSKSLW